MIANPKQIPGSISSFLPSYPSLYEWIKNCVCVLDWDVSAIFLSAMQVQKDSELSNPLCFPGNMYISEMQGCRQTGLNW